jgi:hypothetical protein
LDDGRRKTKLKAYGIAPPVYSKNNDELFSKTDEVECPLCSSKHTHLVSQLVPQHAKHYTSAMIAKNLLIILNAIRYLVDGC